jgi:uncharacterized protein YprB with RNaseH-like and TPR domain
MTTDLRDKLRQLGVTKGMAKEEAKVRPPRRHRRRNSIESLVDGQLVESPLGRAFVAQERYTLDHRHGNRPLAGLLKQQAAVAAQLGREPKLAEVDLSRAVLLDTETTGLSSGTGTLAFLVGIGTFEEEAFQLRQFFLCDPDEEAAMLAALSDVMQDQQAIITFNGRGFDLPLLQTRYTLARMRPDWLGLPHLDLLPPARRVWRERLVSCALSSLEVNILGVRRTQDDVPGFEIPQMYQQYLLTGDASDMLRVMYHNRQDILSMVTLATQLCRMFSDPFDDEEREPADLVSLGRWYDDLGLTEQAERAFRAALEREAHVPALFHLGYLLKRQERREEALAIWQRLAESDTSDVTAHVELAKHFEWHAGDVKSAIVWTRAALDLAVRWPSSSTQDQWQAELEHRLERLERKASSQKRSA